MDIYEGKKLAIALVEGGQDSQGTGLYSSFYYFVLRPIFKMFCQLMCDIISLVVDLGRLLSRVVYHLACYH
jgi:hypothetical protein